ncbi:MAG: hypothetical protein HDT37_04700, partial [Clostridiales bacterium]|nr:hypothetical protein [Clostridiales bacterium]
MKRRILSLIIALALCLNLCPVGALAAGEETADGVCSHHPAHTDECGYVPGSPDAPCTFVCQICPVEDLTGSLSDSVSENNGGQVQDQPGGMEPETLSDGSGGSAASGRTYELTEDISYPAPYEISELYIFRTNRYTFTGPNSTAIRVIGTGELYLSGTVVSKNGAGVEVLSGGFLSITEPETSISGTTCALDIASGAKVHLTAGTYIGKSTAIQTADGDLAALLEPGYAYFDPNGSLLLPADAAEAKRIVIDQCPGHSGKTYTHTSGTTTHAWTCPYCGAEETEACTFTFGQDGNGSCGFCENTIAIVVDERDLTGLVYDGTVKPEEVSI